MRLEEFVFPLRAKSAGKPTDDKYKVPSDELFDHIPRFCMQCILRILILLGSL